MAEQGRKTETDVDGFDAERAQRLLTELQAFRATQVYEQTKIAVDTVARILEKGEEYYFGRQDQEEEEAVEDDASVGSEDLPSLVVGGNNAWDPDEDIDITVLSSENSTEFAKKQTVHAFAVDAPVTIDKPWGLSVAEVGDFVVANPKGDLYCVPREKFEASYAAVPGRQCEFRKTRAVLGRRMVRDFKITLGDGEEQAGSEGDFLVQDHEEEQWIVRGDVFHETYEPAILSQHSQLLSKMAGGRRAGPEDGDPMQAVYLGRRVRREMMELLEASVQEWDLDVFELSRLTHGHALFHLSSHLFESHGMVGSMRLPGDKFARFLLELENSYQTVPFHNATLAADAVQAVSYFLLHTDMMAQLRNEEVFALLLAAAASCAGHPGTDNGFQVATQSQLAVLYNDQHVLQHFHAAQTFQLLASDKFGILDALSREQRRVLRLVLVTTLLGADPDGTARLVDLFRTRRRAWFSYTERETAFGSDPQARWRARGGSMLRPSAAPGAHLRGAGGSGRLRQALGGPAGGAALGSVESLGALAEEAEEEADGSGSDSDTEGTEGGGRGAGAGADGSDVSTGEGKAGGAGLGKNPFGSQKSAQDVRAEMAAAGQAVDADAGADVSFSSEAEADRLLLLTVALRCGTLAHATKSPKIARKWGELLAQEWEQQAEKERTAGVPARDTSPLATATAHRDELRDAVKPLFTEFCDHFGQRQLLLNININLAYWDKEVRSLGGASESEARGASAPAKSKKASKAMTKSRAVGTLFLRGRKR